MKLVALAEIYKFLVFLVQTFEIAKMAKQNDINFREPKE